MARTGTVRHLDFREQGAAGAQLLREASAQTGVEAIILNQFNTPPFSAAELAANAVRHGRVQGRDFRVALTFVSSPGVLRIEVTDPRGERLPALSPDPEDLSYEAESGRGLLLVAAFADRWGVEPYPPSGKTVWAEVGPAGAEEGASPSGAPSERPGQDT